MKKRNRLPESLLKMAMDMREGGILDDVACKTITCAIGEPWRRRLEGKR
jgi:hypothetical protein